MSEPKREDWQPYWQLPTALTNEHAQLKARAEQAEADLTALVAACRTLVEEIDCLCQAVEGHRGGALTNDGLWHYVEKARTTVNDDLLVLLARAEGGVRRPPANETKHEHDSSRVDH